MLFNWSPGNCLGCTVNSHRAGWNGTICQAAATWDCTAALQFREDFCEHGDERCFHIHLFDERDPYFVIAENGAAWILETQSDAFDDQILLLWGRQFHEPRGIREGLPVWIVFGAYRIRSVQERPIGHRKEWVVRPYENGWTRLDHLRIASPRWERLSGPYIKQVEWRSAERTFAQAHENARLGGISWRAGDRERFEYFYEHLQEWGGLARERAVSVVGARQQTAAAVFSTGAMVNQPFRALGQIMPAAPAPPPAIRETVSFPKEVFAPVVDDAARRRISERHGARVLTSVLVGSLTKPFLIIRGNPGVGKSDLALSLLDDPKRERSYVVAVASTWRGREDLFGHINPINNLFEPTRFTNFLREAEVAWDQGDRRVRLVVFEEFNLSQPEYWLSEIIVRSQYSPAARQDRTIDLGGEGVRGWPEKGKMSVFLAPSVRFAGTLNSDHTGRPLSPRILDRAAVIELSVTPREAVARCGLELDDAYVEALGDLDFRIRGKGATFSYRTALSLKACMVQMGELGLDAAGVVDTILVQELLSKVRLLAADPDDRRLVDELAEWSETSGKQLFECARVISTWREMLQNGQDVQPA